MIDRYSFESLTRMAIEDPTAENLAALAKWFDLYDAKDWTGEYYDASLPGEPSGTRRLWPIQELDPDDPDGEAWITVGWELR